MSHTDTHAGDPAFQAMLVDLLFTEEQAARMRAELIDVYFDQRRSTTLTGSARFLSVRVRDLVAVKGLSAQTIADSFTELWSAAEQADVVLHAAAGASSPFHTRFGDIVVAALTDSDADGSYLDQLTFAGSKIADVIAADCGAFVERFAAERVTEFAGYEGRWTIHAPGPSEPRVITAAAEFWPYGSYEAPGVRRELLAVPSPLLRAELTLGIHAAVVVDHRPTGEELNDLARIVEAQRDPQMPMTSDQLQAAILIAA